MAINPRISLEHWRSLLAVVDAGGYAQAAEVLARLTELEFGVALSRINLEDMARDAQTLGKPTRSMARPQSG